jgi:hypothetical protein
MAHALPEARSILCLRATRTANRRTSSNIVWNYGHCTIPRHLRDIVVTEYGTADLRGRTDREVAEAMIDIMDARFQDEFVGAAVRARKLPKGFRVPAAARANTPASLQQKFAAWRTQGYFPETPFGSELTAEEIVLGKALRGLADRMQAPFGRIRAMIDAFADGKPGADVRPYLARMQLQDAQTFRERVYRRAVSSSVRKTLAKR